MTTQGAVMAEKTGFFASVRRAWNSFWSAGPRPTTLYEYEPPTGSDVLPVAARGDVFDLHIVPYFHWSSQEMSFEKLAERSALYVEPARGRLLRAVWSEARRFGPTQLAEAEAAINALKEVKDGWCHYDREGLIKCVPTVRVLLDPRLRDQLVPFELRLRELDAAHDHDKRKAAYVEELTEVWLQIIRRLETSQARRSARSDLTDEERQLLTPFAGSLVERDFAVVMHGLAERRRTMATDLVAALQEASKDHEGVGLFEFAKAYDMAAQAYSRQLGLGPHRWNLEEMNVAGSE
jgi:hypothetical protein